MKITHNTIFKKLTSKQTNIRDQIMSFLSYFLRETTNHEWQLRNVCNLEYRQNKRIFKVYYVSTHPEGQRCRQLMLRHGGTPHQLIIILITDWGHYISPRAPASGNCRHASLPGQCSAVFSVYLQRVCFVLSLRFFIEQKDLKLILCQHFFHPYDRITYELEGFFRRENSFVFIWH